MTGTVMRPAVTLGGTAVDMSNPQTLSPSYVNSFRISAVTSRLLAHLRGEANTDITEFCNLCLSLARGIDYAVSNNDIPGRAPDLPYMLKQVCQRKNDLQSQAAIMVLMISVKSACTNGWFSDKATEELHALSDDMQSSFCSVSVKDINSNMKNKETEFHPTISTIMSRFYPGMKMGEILSFVVSKPGYDSYVTDLHISKRARTSDDKIYLFVAQTDNTETSLCITSPQQVNFLLNGEGVDRRTCVKKDPGPQMPTPVTHMLKYGSNLLQVVGQFNGRYVIVIAFMSVVANFSFPSVPDYIPPVSAPHDSDNEIVEGPSTISLKCPISFSRIKTPVKGRTCKHLQCFDFNNYVGINSRRPLWRCPHCSQSVCFHDIRIDQSIVKVLKEVGENVTFVKISADGSWETVAETNDNSEKPNDASPSHQETNNQDAGDIMDLTGNDNEVYKDDDQKPCPAGEPCVLNKTAPHMEDGFWQEFYSSDLPSRTANIRSDSNDVVQRNHQLFNSLSQSQIQSQIPASNNVHMRYSTPNGWVTRTQSAIQALPAQSSAMAVDGDRQQQNFSRSHLNQHQVPHQVSRMNSFPSSQHTSSQNQGQRDHLPVNQTSSQLGARSASPQQMNGSRHTSPLTENRFHTHQHQQMNQRTPLPTRPSHQFRHAGMGPMTNLPSSQSPYSLSSIHRATQQVLTNTPSIPPPIQTPASSVTVALTGDQRVDASAEENWRPSGRMRGSLSGGREYTEGLNIIHPNQPVQAARPPPVLNTPRPFIPPHLQALMVNQIRPPTPQASPSSDPAGGSTDN